MSVSACVKLLCKVSLFLHKDIIDFDYIHIYNVKGLRYFDEKMRIRKPGSIGVRICTDK